MYITRLLVQGQKSCSNNIKIDNHSVDQQKFMSFLLGVTGFKVSLTLLSKLSFLNKSGIRYYCYFTMNVTLNIHGKIPPF